MHLIVLKKNVFSCLSIKTAFKLLLLCLNSWEDLAHHQVYV